MMTPVPNAVLVSAAVTSTMTHPLTVTKGRSSNTSSSANRHEMPIRRFKPGVADWGLQASLLA